MLQLEPGMMIWTWVTFVVLFFVLAKVAWKPILAAVEEREKGIKDSIQRAEDAKNEAQRLLEEQEQKIAGAQEEIQKMISESKDLAEKMKSEIVEKARQEAQKLREKAHADIEREKDAAIIELKKQVADLSIGIASKLMQENLDVKKHHKIIDGYIDELDQLNKN